MNLLQSYCLFRMVVISFADNLKNSLIIAFCIVHKRQFSQNILNLRVKVQKNEEYFVPLQKEFRKVYES